MGKLLIKPSKGIRGEISVPGDKSISHRAVMLGALARGETVINGFLPSADCWATINCFRELGIEIVSTNNNNKIQKIIIKGKGLFGLQKPKMPLYVGNSGTTIRLLMGILAGQNFSTEMNGDESIKRRPMLRVVKPLREMGGEIRGSGDQGIRGSGKEEIFAPLKIVGRKLKGITYALPVASAQVKSAILLAGLYAEGKTEVTEINMSRNHTEKMMGYFGCNIRVNGPLSIVSGGHEFSGTTIDVPGDISSAAFFMVAALLVPNSEIIIHNVGLNPTRTGILDVLHRMGAKIEVLSERLVCEEPRGDILVRSQSSMVRGIKIAGEIIPRIIDEIPIIALAATQAEGITEIVGAKELRVKESDRIKTVCSELKKMGAKIEEREDGMVIQGGIKLQGAKVNSFGDHRIAMMLAIAGLIAEGSTEIEDTDCIETSFPGFENTLMRLC